MRGQIGDEPVLGRALLSPSVDHRERTEQLAVVEDRNDRPATSNTILDLVRGGDRPAGRTRCGWCGASQVETLTDPHPDLNGLGGRSLSQELGHPRKQDVGGLGAADAAREVRKNASRIRRCSRAC